MALKILLFVLLLALVNSKLVRHSPDAIAELEAYIESRIPEINDRYRLHYHVMGPVGWINDPNGFSFYKGEYHLFYQYYPYDSVWGPMHWGHVSSTDLVHWKQLPTALLPEEEMCFSGSAVVDGDNFVLMYTGRVESTIDPFFNESQYLAFSDDGIYFEKYEGNPVIEGSPNGNPDFRDPKTWKYGDYWYTVIGSTTTDGRGNTLLYRSLDLFNWEYLAVIAEAQDPNVYMYECPDFFELDGKFVLLFSPQGMETVGDRYKNVYQTGYIIGSFNYDTYEFVPEVEFQEMDYGHDFYAAQTMENEGKRYLISWFNMWEKPFYPEAADGWAGAMTIVREISIVNNRIIMKPVSAMNDLREDLVVDGVYVVNQEAVFDKTAEINIDGDLNNDIVLQLEGTDGGQTAWLRYDATNRTVTVDLGNEDFRRVEWEPLGSTSWRLFLDATSLELFCGEGEVVFSTRVYPEGGWKVTNLSPQDLNIEAYSLKRSFPYNSASGFLPVSRIIILLCSFVLTISYWK